MVRFKDMGIEESESCLFDFIEFRDGAQPDAPLIGRFCGFRSAGIVASTRQAMYVRFKSDNSASYRGFSAAFTVGRH